MPPSIIVSVTYMLVVVAVFSVLGDIAPPVGLEDGGLVDLVSALDRQDYQHAVVLAAELRKRSSPVDSDDEVRLLAARACLGAGDANSALAALVGLEDRLSEVADVVLRERALAWLQSQKWDQALASWRALMERAPQSPLASDARYGVADALYALSRWQEAETAYEMALRASPRSTHEPFARLRLAEIAERNKKWVLAAAGYNYLANYRPNDPAAQQARERLDGLARRGHARPASVQQRLAQVDVLLRGRSIAEAEAALAAIVPDNKSALRVALAFRSGQIAYRRQEYSTAAAIFVSLVNDAPARDRVRYELWLARTYSTAQRYDDAIATYLQISERERQSRIGRETLFKAAWLAYYAGDAQRSYELFEQYLQKYPRDPMTDEVFWYQAWTAYHLRDFPLALSTLSRLRERFPASGLVPQSWYWQARVSAQMGDEAAAQFALRQVIASGPYSYYGVLASQRLRHMEATRGGRSGDGAGSSIVISAVFAVPPGDGADARQCDDAGAEGVGLVRRDASAAALPASEPPWRSTSLAWRSPAGARVIRLLRLGFKDLAADAIFDIPAVEGASVVDVAYARARLLYAVGDFGAAYELLQRRLGTTMRIEPTLAPRPYLQLVYPDAYSEQVTTAAREFGVSPLVVLAMMRQESGFDNRARSSASAHGLMQIIPVTASKIAAALGTEGYDESRLRDPAVSVRFGAWYMTELLKKFGGNVVLAIGAYNAGPVAMQAWVDDNGGRPIDEFVEDIPFRETRHYVKRVLGNLAVYTWLYREAMLSLPEEVPSDYLDNISF